MLQYDSRNYIHVPCGGAYPWVWISGKLGRGLATKIKMSLTKAILVLTPRVNIELVKKNVVIRYFSLF